MRLSFTRCVPLIIAGALLVSTSARAEVTKVTIANRTVVADGQLFGQVGPYEKLTGTIEFALDPADKHNARIVDLIKAKRDAVAESLRLRLQQIEAGRGTIEDLYLSSKRLADAELELQEKKADRIAALEAHFKRMKDNEEMMKLRFEAGQATGQDFAMARYYRYEAELALEREKAMK